MSLSMFLSGMNGALGLYYGVKGALDARRASDEAKQLRKNAQAEESSWYRRNYYGNFLDNTAASAAMKRVENTLRRHNAQSRARMAITGATPEYSLALGEQGLRSMENVVTNLASMDSDRKIQIDAAHRQNRAAMLGNELNTLAMDERMAESAVGSGLNLFQNAMLGVEWGRERN